MVLSKRKFLTGITFAAGLTLGVLAFVAFQFFDSLEEQGGEGIDQRDDQHASTKRGMNFPSDANVHEQNFHEIFSSPRIAEQYRQLYMILSHATETELNNWWAQALQIERESHREIAQEVIIGCVTVLNPEKALLYLEDVSKLQYGSLLTTVFSEWSILRLDEAVDAASDLRGTQRKIALQAILETRDDLSDVERRSIAAKLDGTESYQILLSNTRAFQAIAEPEKSWSILLNDDVDDARQIESFSKVALAWHQQIGFDVLQKINGLGLFGIRDDLVNVIAQVDLAGALDYTRDLLDKNVKESLSKIIVREWARANAQAALAAASTFEPSSLASDLEGEVAITWARTNPIELIENIGKVSEQSRLWPLTTAFSRVAREEPTRAIAMLSSVKSFVGNTSSILNSVVESWALQQPNAATDWVLNNIAEEDPERPVLLGRVLQYLANHNPVRAFELALEEPDPKDGSGLERVVVQRIAFYGDIKLAKEFLPRVRASSKLPTYTSVATAMIDLDQTSEAMELGKELEESDQESYYQRVLGHWAYRKPKNLYESLKNLPLGHIQSYAAQQLIFLNRHEPILTHDQIDHAKSFLTSNDEASLKR